MTDSERYHCTEVTLQDLHSTQGMVMHTKRVMTKTKISMATLRAKKNSMITFRERKIGREIKSSIMTTKKVNIQEQMISTVHRMQDSPTNNSKVKVKSPNIPTSRVVRNKLLRVPIMQNQTVRNTRRTIRLTPKLTRSTEKTTSAKHLAKSLSTKTATGKSLRKAGSKDRRIMREGLSVKLNTGIGHQTKTASSTRKTGDIRTSNLKRAGKRTSWDSIHLQ